MSQTYPDLSLSNFPDSIDNQRVFSDISIETADDIQLYYQYINSKNFVAALQLLNDKPALKRCIIDALTMNTFEHRIIAIEKFYMRDVQTFIMEAVSYKGAWMNTVSYNKLNVVSYNGSVYMATQNNIPIGILPTNTSYYVPLAIKGEQGETGLGLSPRGEWDAATHYYQYDLVSYNNRLWYALNSDVKGAPYLSSTEWAVALDISTTYTFF